MNIASPYNFGAQWTNGDAECTQVGERMHYLSGLKRRKEYIERLKFLPDIYTPGTIYAISTDTNRTIMSGHAHLLGMYPLEKRDQLRIDSENKYPKLSGQVITQKIPLKIAGKGLLDGFDTYV